MGQLYCEKNIGLLEGSLMGSEESIIKEIRELAIGVAQSATLDSEQDYDRPMNEIGVDSLDAMSLFLEVQEKLGVDIPDEVVDELVSIRDIAKYVVTHKD